MHDCTRRRLLAATGTVGVGALAGCLGDGDDEDPSDGGTDPGSDPDGFEDVEGTVLGDITIDNLHEEGHEVDVQVDIDGSRETWRTVEIEARTGGRRLDREWPTDGGRFRVGVRIDRAEFVEVTPEDYNDPDCVSLFVLITSDGDLRVAGDTTGGFCAA